MTIKIQSVLPGEISKKSFPITLHDIYKALLHSNTQPGDAKGELRISPLIRPRTGR